jgi:hypothetical protein
MAHDEWSVDDIYRHLVGLRGPQKALPELVTALRSGRLLVTMRVHDIYDGRVTWRRELAAHWFRDYFGVALVDGKAKLVVIRALVGFHESTFTIPGWRVLRLWPKSPSSEAENECWAWLEVLAKGYPDRPPKPRPKLWAQAQQRWPRLSQRAFDRGWRRVVEAGAGWARPGRPKR